MRAPDRIIVLGAGAIGSVYAAKLASRHHVTPVTVVARRDHVEAIRRDGLRLVGREDLTARVDAVTTVDSIAPGTLILLTTKVNDSQAAVAPLADLVRSDTVIVCVQNGLCSEEIARKAVGGRCLVLRAVTQFGAIFQAPGVIDYKVAGHTLIEPHAVSAAIAGLLSASGLDGRVSANIAVDVWRKVIFNCVINPITSIIGSEVGAIADTRLDPLKRPVIDECLKVAAADGVEFDIESIGAGAPPPARTDADPSPRIHGRRLGVAAGASFLRALRDIFGASRNIASMRQDLLKGKPTEIDHMNGAVVDLGRRFGIPCPVNAALVMLIKAMEASSRRGAQ